MTTPKKPFIFNSRIILILIVASISLFVNCGKKPGHDKTPYLMKKKLGLNNEQAKALKKIIDEMKDHRSEERHKYAGDYESLLKAARARNALEKESISALLTENQKARFRQMTAGKELTDQAVIISEHLGLDRTTTNRINKIAVNLPSREEAMAAKKSGDPAALKAFNEKTKKIYKEIDYFLKAQQKVDFNKLIEEMAD